MALVSSFIFASTFVSIIPASAAGTCTSTFPQDSSWKPVRNTTGGLLTDPLNDVGGGANNSDGDIYGTEATTTSAAGSAIDWYSRGTGDCFQFRMRIAQSALSGSRIDNRLWIVGLGTGTTTKAFMVVNGNNSGSNSVEIFNGSSVLIFSYAFDNAGSNNDYAYVTSLGSGASIRHYVYWQVPYADLISVLGDSTIYGFFAGTSQSNSFSSINGDCLPNSVGCSVTYASTQKVDLSQDASVNVEPPIISSLSVTKGSTSGGTPIVLTGTNLTNPVRVLFGNLPATITSFTSTSVTVTTPAGSTGDVSVQVETALGGLSNTLTRAFKYITAPSVTTVEATGITSTTAQFNGTVNPGNDATTTSFCYGTSNTLDGDGALQSCTSRSSTSLAASTNSNFISYSQSLSASTTYYFQAIAINDVGTTYGSVLSFTTPTDPVALSITNSLTITSGQVRVSYSYQFTATGGSGTYSDWQLTSGSLPSGLSLSSSGLLNGTPTAIFSAADIEITVTDSEGASSSKTFSLSIAAGQPSVSTLDATSVTQTTATLNGNVNDNGATTTVSWCMSTDAAVNTETGALYSCTQISVSASPSSLTSGSGFTAISGSVSSLVAGTTYYFQLKAVNSVGTVYGSIKSFVAVTKTDQSTLSLTLSPTSKTYPSYSQIMNMTSSQSGATSSGITTYQIIPGGTATECSLSNSSATATLTSTSAGTCLISATKSGDGTYNAISSSTETFTFSKANQTLSFVTTSYSRTYGQSQTVSATGSGSGSVTYSVGSSTACTITGASVTITASTGSCEVTATITSDVFYNSANSSNSVTITVGQASQTISFGSLSNKTLGSGTFTVSATGGASGNSVTFTSATTDKCTVASTTVTLVAAGTCTISADQLGNDNYSAASQVQQSFTISAADPLSITTPSSGLSGIFNTSYSLAITSSGGTGSKTYSLSSGTLQTGLTLNSSTGTISGTPTEVSSKAVVVTVTDGASTIAATSNFTITVGQASQTISFGSLSNKTLGSGTFTVSATGGASGNSVTFTSATTDKCTVASTTVTLVAAGTCTISADQLGNDNYSAASQVQQSFTINAFGFRTENPSSLRKNQVKLKGSADDVLDVAKFCFKAESFLTVSNCGDGTERSANLVDSDYEFDQSGLDPSTTYYYYFFGNKNGTSFTGESKSFKTLPEVVTNTGSSIAARSARLNATVSEALTDPKFCYKANSFSTLAQCLDGGVSTTAGTSGALRAKGSLKKTSLQVTWGYLKAKTPVSPSGALASDVTYRLDVSGLNPNTTYYFIIYGSVDSQQYDGGVQNFTTPAEESGGGGTGGSSDGSGAGGGGSDDSGGSSSTSVVTPGPTINSISKSLVCFTGTEFTISGSNFNDGRVTLDGTSVTIRDISGSTIKVSLPLSSIGRRTITVTTPHGSAVAYIEYVSVPKPKFEPIRIPYLAQGSLISLPFVASNATTYGLVGKLPSGLTMNHATGEISGTSTENGIFVLTLTASNLCGETKQLVELDIDAPTPNAISHRINFLPGSCSIPDSAKAYLEAFLEKAKGLSPRNLIPEIYVSGGGKANDSNSPLADCRQEAICDLLLLENLLGEVLSDVFTGSENRIEIIVYWPRPNDDL